MKKYTLQFTTKIRGEVTVQADSLDEAFSLGDELAQGTLNYEELSDSGRCAPDVETECEDGWVAKS